MCSYFGVTAYAFIEPDPSAIPLEAKTWIGQCRSSIADLDRLSMRRRMMIGLAGMLAERAWDGRHDPDTLAHIADEMMDPDCMSPSDWRMAFHRPGDVTTSLVRAAEMGERLLNSGGVLWPDLLGTTRTLMREGIADWNPALSPARRKRA